MTDFITHFISSKSKEEKSNSNTDFYHSLKIPHSHNKISLISCSFPKSFYLVESGKNTFYLDGDDYTIPIGNYSVNEFVTAVNNLLTPSTISFNTRTGKLTLTSSASELIFPANSTLYKLFGFDKESTNTIGGSLESTYLCDFQALSSVFVITDLCVDESSKIYDNTLHSFFVNTSSDLSYIGYENINPISTSKELTTHNIGKTDVQNINAYFRFLDEDGNILDLNGLHIDLVCVTYISEERRNVMSNLFKRWVNFDINRFQEERSRERKNN